MQPGAESQLLLGQMLLVAAPPQDRAEPRFHVSLSCHTHTRFKAGLTEFYLNLHQGNGEIVLFGQSVAKKIVQFAIPQAIGKTSAVN